MSSRPDILRTVSTVSATGIPPATLGSIDGDFVKKKLHLVNLPQKMMGFTQVLPATPGSVSGSLSAEVTTNSVFDSDAPEQINPDCPPWPAFRGYHTFSFANATMGHRLPTILGKAIEDALCTINSLSDEDDIVDLLACVKRMEILKAELEGNGKLRPIIDDGEADVTLWNKEIAKWFAGGSTSI